MSDRAVALVKCRGCNSGAFVPLKIQRSAQPRYIYTHAYSRNDPNGCGHHERFDNSIDNLDDLMAATGVELKLKDDAPDPGDREAPPNRRDTLKDEKPSTPERQDDEDDEFAFLMGGD